MGTPCTVSEPDEYLVARIQDAIACDERAGEQGIDVRVAGGRVFLHGTVASQERRDAIGAVAADHAQGLVVCNETTVLPPVDTDGMEALA